MQVHNKVQRTLNITKTKVVCFNEKTNNTETLEFLLNNKLKVSNVMKQVRDMGYTPIKVLSLEYTKQLLEMDLDTFVKYAKEVDEF